MITTIALMGPAGAGKTTVANYLEERYGARRFGLAGPLKEIAKRVMAFSDEQLYGTQEQKEAIDPRYGMSARTFLQKLGTDGCRDIMGEDIWTDTCIRTILGTNPVLAVVDDMRFVSEAYSFRNDHRFRGYVWRLWPIEDAETAARAAAAGVHASEREWSFAEADVELRPKARGVEELLALVDYEMSRLPNIVGVSW